MRMPDDMTPGTIHTSYKGLAFKVVKYTDHSRVSVKFIETGYTTSIHVAQVRSGEVKDKLTPSVCGVGYIGGGKHAVSNNGIRVPEYNMWNYMLTKCQPKGGRTMCKEWLNFQNFAAWFKLSKRICSRNRLRMLKGNVYSPENCELV